MSEHKTNPEVLARIIPMLRLDTSRPPIWEPYYPLEDSTYRRGWNCSCCGKHSFSKKSVCDGCNSQMINADGGEVE